MKITILQQDIYWRDIALNLRHVDNIVDSISYTDLIVLPEMFSTGFCINPKEITIQNNVDALLWMKKTAKKRNCAIAGSIAMEQNGYYYNRFYFVHPDGQVDYYDKKHLFTYGEEHKYFTAGNDRVIVTFRGIRILLQVCYDLRFPIWTRNRNDYDVIMYVASWPTSRIEAWSALLVARAIENQCYVVGVNRVGSDPSCEYCGNSVIIDPYGKTIVACTQNTETTASAEIDKEKLIDFRQKFPVLNDADKFQILNIN